jgi:hypothetical protein
MDKKMATINAIKHHIFQDVVASVPLSQIHVWEWLMQPLSLLLYIAMYFKNVYIVTIMKVYLKDTENCLCHYQYLQGQCMKGILLQCSIWTNVNFYFILTRNAPWYDDENAMV